MPYTGGSHTYYSTETLPKTVRLVDVRTDEVVFSVDVPPGKQLTLDFVEGAGDDPVYSPDLLRYQIFDIGTTIGKLHNSLTIPAASSRRLDMFVRQGPEYVIAAPDRELRTDEIQDRPDWWTPSGGELPDDPKAMKSYDD